MKLFKILLSMALVQFMLKPQSVEAKHILKDSFLCKDKNLLYTMVGFSTKDFDVAICKDEDNSLYYIGQDRKSKATMFLPTIQENDPYESQKNYWVYKAKNGEYIYQVAVFFTPPDPNNKTQVSLSVFKNGKKIYNAISKTILVGEYGDM